MSKDLNGWDQPEEMTPETARDKAASEETAASENVEIDIPVGDDDFVAPDGDGPELTIDSDEAREYARAKENAEQVVKKHKLVETAKQEPKHKNAKKKERENHARPETEPEGELVLEDVLLMGEEAGQDAQTDGAEPAAVAKHDQTAYSARGLGRTKQMLWGRRSHTYAAPLGFAFIILAIIGLISVIILCVNLTANIVDNTEEKSAFEWKIYPLLMFDPAAFDSPTQLDEVFVLKTALWKTLLENRTKYTYNDNGMLVVPASDLDVAAKSLYGDVIKLSHQSFSEGYEFFYIYDEEQNAYLVPVQGQTAQYSPKVIKITKNDNLYTLLVGYVPPNDLWNIDTEGNMTEPSPSKYMYYDLQKTDSGYIIVAVREVPKEELPEDAGTGGQQQLNQTRYDEYVEGFMASQSAAASGDTSSYKQAVGADSLDGTDSGSESASGDSGSSSGSESTESASSSEG